MNRFQKIEILRHSDPAKSLSESWALSETCARSDVPKALGEVGSSLRALTRFADADETLLVGLALAASSRERKIQSDLIRRRALVRVSMGVPAEALRLTEKAIPLAASAGSRRHIGRAFQARGLALHWMEKYAESNEAADAAIRYLSTPYDLFSSFLAKAMNFLCLGDFSGHDRWLTRAVSQDVPRAVQSLALWVVNERELAVGCPRKAAAGFEGLSVFFLDTGQHIQCALSTLLALQAWTREGEFRRAFELGRSMIKLIGPLENSLAEPAVSAVALSAVGSEQVQFARKLQEAESTLRRAAARPSLQYA